MHLRRRIRGVGAESLADAPHNLPPPPPIACARADLTAAALALSTTLGAAQSQTIVQIAEATPELADLVDAVVAGGLVNTLNGCVQGAAGWAAISLCVRCNASASAHHSPVPSRVRSPGPFTVFAPM